MIAPITGELVTIASLLVKAAHPQDQSLHRALANAEPRLVDLPWRVDGGVLAITSHSHPSEIHYVTDDRCDCLTRKGTCWHRAAYMILSVLAAAGVALLAPLPLPMTVVEQDRDDWPDSFLDGDFRAFDDAPYLAA